MTLRLERVLATVDWAHIVLEGSGQASGYAMDPRPRPPKDNEAGRSARAHSPGLFARYLRGDTTPSSDQLYYMDERVEGSWSRFSHPVYRLLAKPTTEWYELVEILDDLALSLHCRIFDIDGAQGPGKYQLPTTSRRQTDLAVQGDGYALTALLALALHAKGEENFPLALDVATRAYQCMLFAFARGEFWSIRSALAARIRQQILDQIECNDMVLDTASLDIEAGIARLRELLERHHLVEPTANSAARRRLFRQILAGEHTGVLPLITPRRVPVAMAAACRAQHQRPIEMDSQPRGRFQHVPRFGKRARSVLRAALAGYWVD
jgi:hypothetical protein